MARPGTILAFALLLCACEFPTDGGAGTHPTSCNAQSGGGLYCPTGGDGPWTCHADQAGLTCDSGGGNTVCYFPSGGSAGGGPPSATVEYALESMSGMSVVHVRLTFDRGFVDNTYGATAVGWGAHGHKFTDLVGSDH